MSDYQKFLNAAQENNLCIISHGGGCIDGKFAAALLMRAFGLSYDQVLLTFRDKAFTQDYLDSIKGKPIIMADIVMFREHMEVLKQYAASITIFEHHRGTKETTEEFGGIFNNDQCGAMLVLTELLMKNRELVGFNLSKSLELVLNVICNKDRFTIIWQVCLAIQYIHAEIVRRCKNLDTTVEFINELSEVTDFNTFVEDITAKGKVLYDEEQEMIASLVARAVIRTMRLKNGKTIKVAHLAFANRKEKAFFSQVGDLICAKFGVAAVMTIKYEDMAENELAVSIITTDDTMSKSGLSAADIAELLGGKRAHKHCTGITVDYAETLFQ